MVDEAKLAELFRSCLHETYGGQASQLVVLDGKTLRGTIPKGKTQGVHLLAVYLPEEGVVLGQVEVGLKENEISAAGGELTYHNQQCQFSYCTVSCFPYTMSI